MSATLVLLALWAGFAATHIGLASVRLRPRLVARLGEPIYQGVYSAVALAFFVPLVWVYFANKHAGTWLWVLPRGELLTWILYAGNAVALVLFVAAFVQPSPAGMAPSKGEVRGALRLTRHPLFMAIALWAGLHLLPNGSSADVAFFGGMVVFALVGSWHQDRRKQRTGPPGYAEFCAKTPFLPFTGRETLQGMRELGPLTIGLGLGATLLLRTFHSTLFGP